MHRTPAMTRLDGVPNDIALLAGPLYLGTLFGYGLYGILSVQLFIYTHRFPRDPFWMKTLVWVIFFIETLITVLGTIAGWKVLASGWGDPAVLVPLDWAFASLGLLSGLVASSAHFFYCWRIYKLRKLLAIPIILATVSLVTCGMAAFCGIYGHQLGFAGLRYLRPWVIVWLGGSALVDASITVCMVTILLQARSRSYYNETSSLIQRLITLTIETAMTTGFAALAQVILFIVFSHNNMHFLMFLMLAKLYSNTLLTALNARAFIGPQDVVAVPALWEDESTVSSQRALSNRRALSVPPSHISMSTNTRYSQGTDHIRLQEMVFASDPDASLSKIHSVSHTA